MFNFALALVDGFFWPCLSRFPPRLCSTLRLSLLSTYPIAAIEFFHRRSPISPFSWTFLLLLRQMKGLVMAGLARHVQESRQKTAARSKVHRVLGKHLGDKG